MEGDEGMSCMREGKVGECVEENWLALGKVTEEFRSSWTFSPRLWVLSRSCFVWH